ncbi:MULTISPECIES: DUF4254 domain-containing protein [Nocardia]|uniref:DUF4254 domain-containing protein n=1 Tax=Nocardia sputorum TaxID=2984338 RepID=A0ABN6UA37_9NOCA|nr:DUF4254 domain-containing protein [Nocardia sputorum]BDT94790.1 hypothetical protein IFM12275_47660 [Nocardia sputorum]BDU01958.1 hypothetical protein IFM12276_49860 [Nocardia sputorum]
MPTEYAQRSFGTEELPPPAALLRAIREPGENQHRHSVLHAARQLVDCHERRQRTLTRAHAPGASSTSVAACSQQVEDIDGCRAEWIGRIDAWVAANVQHREGASLHTETLGAVIDRIAAKWVAARHTLGDEVTAGPQPAQAGDAAHLQWTRLAELIDGYQDLITDVIAHRRRLPVW